MPIFHARISQTGAGQTLQILRLPDIPGRVLLIHRVKLSFESFSAVTALMSLLAHNTGPGFTFQTSEPENAWNQLPIIGDGASSPVEQVYDPTPYELVGAQRWVVINSAGNVIVRLAILYSWRREPNQTLWSELRARTSFSTG